MFDGLNFLLSFFIDIQNVKFKVINLIILVFLIIFSIIYVGNVLFGPTSLETLSILKRQEIFLKQEISSLKGENAVYLKKYFDLKAVEPE